MTDPIVAFLEAMHAAGIRPLEPISDKLSSGDPVRFRADGDKPRRRNGWAWLHLDGVPAGVFRHYRLGIRTIWRADSDPCALSPADRRAILDKASARETRRRVETLAKQTAAAGAARDLWCVAGRPDPAHGYLVRKGLAPLGVRQRVDALLVPMVNPQFFLWNVQRIYPDGRKLFLASGRTEGMFWPHGVHMQDGSPSTGPLVIGEGFATMLAIHLATRHAVVAAMSSHNLPTVAGSVRKLFPTREIIIAADDDTHLTHNVGLNAAKDAARIADGSLAIPRPRGRTRDTGTDFADLSRDEIAALIVAARSGG